MKKLNDLYDTWLTVGIITDLTTFFQDMPWRTDFPDSSAFNINYHANHSGNKIVSPLLEALTSDGNFTTAEHQMIASVIHNTFINKWNKLYDTLSFTYNPIENYRMTETGSKTGSDTLTYASQLAVSGSDTYKDTTAEDISTTNNNTNQVYGFNSSSGNNADKQSGTTSVDDDTTLNHTGSNSRTDKHTGNDAHATTGSHTLTRSGNIGVTTSQQMIESERQLWIWNFFETVYRDIDSIVCCDFWED